MTTIPDVTPHVELVDFVKITFGPDILYLSRFSLLLPLQGDKSFGETLRNNNFLHSVPFFSWKNCVVHGAEQHSWSSSLPYVVGNLFAAK